MDIRQQNKVDKIKKKINKKRKKDKFIDMKISVFLTTDWADYFFNKMSLWVYERERASERLKEDLIKGNLTKEAQDGISNSDIISDVQLKRQEEYKKKLYSFYTGIEEEIIKDMSWGDIDEAILRNSSFGRRLKRVLKRN